MPTRRDWLTVSSKTAPSLFVAAARLLDYAPQKSPGTGRLTTCAVTCHRHPPARCYSHRHLHLNNSPLLALLSSQGLFGNGGRGGPRVAPSQTAPVLPALRHRERDVFVDRSTANDRSSRAETCATRRVMQPAWPRCGGQPPLRNTCRVEERSALRDDEMPL